MSEATAQIQMASRIYVVIVDLKDHKVRELWGSHYFLPQPTHLPLHLRVAHPLHSLHHVAPVGAKVQVVEAQSPPTSAYTGVDMPHDEPSTFVQEQGCAILNRLFLINIYRFGHEKPL